jgi:transcriptional regulator with XRE-family HTH domain
MMIMPPRLGEVIKQARQARRLTLRRLADQVLKEDATPISPQYLFDIEVHHRVPAPHVLRELARVLALEYGTLLALAGGADVVVQESSSAILRLDQTTATRLQHLVDQFDKPRAAIIRQLIVQAIPEDFPESWQIAVAERRHPSSP